MAERSLRFNGIVIDPEDDPLQLLITPGATGALIAIAQTYLKSASALVFEPYYPYHRHILNELGGSTEVLPLHGEKLELDTDEFRARCRELKSRKDVPSARHHHFVRRRIRPARCSSRIELEAIAAVCHEFDLLCIADEVYEHYVVGGQPHISIATLPGYVGANDHRQLLLQIMEYLRLAARLRLR